MFHNVRIWMQERAVADLAKEQAIELAQSRRSAAVAECLGRMLVTESVRLAAMRGDLPKPMPNPAQPAIFTQSKASDILFGKLGGWSSRNPGWMIFAACVFAILGGAYCGVIMVKP